jgi:hypothetical protein
MRIAGPLAACVLAAGCAHVQLDARSNTVTGAAAPQPGSSVTGGATGLRIQGGTLGAVIAAGVFAAAAIESARDAPPAPELAPGRLVNEQDCTRPIEDWSRNLKCR